MSSVVWEFATQVWRHSGEAAWHFATVPQPVSEEVRELAVPGPGFGSVPVSVTIGTSTWSTSLFPDAASGCYLLPVKKPIREANDLADGDRAHIRIELTQPANASDSVAP